VDIWLGQNYRNKRKMIIIIIRNTERELCVAKPDLRGSDGKRGPQLVDEGRGRDKVGGTPEVKEEPKVRC
jgi:hypothetical protein